MQQEMMEALAFLIELMDMGVDYADASHQTCISFEVDADALRDAYDAHAQTHHMGME